MSLSQNRSEGVLHLLFEEPWQEAVRLLEPTPSQLEHGLELHRSLTVCEAYGFLPGAWTKEAVQTFIEGPDGNSEVDYQRKLNHLRTTGVTSTEETREEFRAALKQAGIHCIVQPVNDYGESIMCTVQRIAAVRHVCLDMPETIFQTTNSAGIDRAKADGRTAVIFSLTGMPTFGVHDMTDPAQLLEWVMYWHSIGVRFMHISYNRRNLFGDGCTELNDGGLSDLGRDLVGVMNKTGIIVDVPHSSRQTLLDACAVSKAPVTVTHAGCKEVWDGARCKSDEEIKAIAETGGYMGIYSVPTLLGENADLLLMLEHLKHALKVVGPEHVVIGTDIAHQPQIPDGMREQAKPRPPAWRKRNAGGWNERAGRAEVTGDPLRGSLAWTNKPLLTVAMVQMGLSDEEIAQIHYGNLKRVLDTLPA